MSESALEQFVEDQLKAGNFESYEQMVAEGLRLLRERETAYDRLAEEFQSAIDRIEQGDPGVEVDIEEIKVLGRKYLAQGKRPDGRPSVLSVRPERTLRNYGSIAQANPTAADKYLEEIYQKTLLYSHRPYLGQAEPTLARRLGQTPQSVRSFLYRNHRCYYWLRGADMWMLGYIDTRRHRTLSVFVVCEHKSLESCHCSDFRP